MNGLLRNVVASPRDHGSNADGPAKPEDSPTAKQIFGRRVSEYPAEIGATGTHGTELPRLCRHRNADFPLRIKLAPHAPSERALGVVTPEDQGVLWLGFGYRHQPLAAQRRMTKETHLCPKRPFS